MLAVLLVLFTVAVFALSLSRRSGWSSTLSTIITIVAICYLATFIPGFHCTVFTHTMFSLSEKGYSDIAKTLTKIIRVCKLSEFLTYNPSLWLKSTLRIFSVLNILDHERSAISSALFLITDSFGFGLMCFLVLVGFSVGREGLAEWFVQGVVQSWFFRLAGFVDGCVCGLWGRGGGGAVD